LIDRLIDRDDAAGPTVIAIMLAVACAAAWLPARRASAVDPIVVLRDL
jgi:ABC-type lipoprotein release transport system permease subunit